MWSSTSPDFDLETFLDHLRATKPPYYCPYPQCKGKVYRSFSGMQKHITSQHKDEIEMANDTKPHDQSDSVEIPTPAIALSPSKMSAPAQRLFDVEVDGRVWRLNVLEPLQVVGVYDKDTDEQHTSAAIIDRYKKSVLHSPSIKPPVAKFKCLDVVQKRVTPLTKDYLKFTQQTPEMLDKTVEYDMDEEDYLWLDIVNEKRNTNKFNSVPETTFEYLMDRLEKECQFQVNQGGVGVDEDALCCVCLDGECHNANVILFCDMCNLAVHQDCYGVPYVPEGQWLCRRCQLSPSLAVDCCLCPNKGGAFKQTSEGLWCHVVCAIWVPDVYFANTVFLEPIEGIEKVHHARYKLKCIVCKQKGVGACIQCHKPSCYTAFHVTCAQSARLYMKVETTNGPRSPVVKKFVYCDMHAPVGSTQKDQSIQARKQNSMKKLRNARRILSQRRNSTPTVSIPVIPVQSLNEIASAVDVSDAESFIRQVVTYWTLKRQSRFGVPLLRRLQVFHQKQQMQTKEQSGNTPELKRQLQTWKRMRNNLEKARLLCELLRKRERLKKDYVDSACELVESQLKPVSSTIIDVINKISVRDRFHVFTQPVSEAEVPGYHSVVKNPMDLSTMKKRAEKGQYKCVNDLQADFKLMLDNCVQFNPKGEFFWKQAQRIRRLGNQAINEARQQDLGNCKGGSKKGPLASVTLALAPQRQLSPFPQFDPPTTVFSPKSEEPKSPPKSPIPKPVRPKTLSVNETNQTVKGRGVSNKQLNNSVSSNSNRNLKRKSMGNVLRSPQKKMKLEPEPEIVEMSLKVEDEKTGSGSSESMKKLSPVRKKGKKKTSGFVQTSITKFLGSESKEKESSPEGGDYLPPINDKNSFNQYRHIEALSPASVPSSSEDSGLDDNVATTSYANPASKRKTPKNKKPKGDKNEQELEVIDMDCGFQFMDLVWAPLPGGHMQMPALVHQENQKSKIYAQVLPIHPAPESILRLKPVSDEPIKLVRFFDNTRTWAWIPVASLILFGIDEMEDERLISLPKKAADKQLISECADRATFARHLIMGETPPDRLLLKYGEEDIDSEEDEEQDSRGARCTLQ